MSKLVERIMNEIEKEMFKTGAMGSETVTVRLEVTEEEFETLTSEEKFSYDYEDGILEVTTSENQLNDVKVIKTESYILGNEEYVEVAKEYYLGQLVDGSEDLESILDSETVAMYTEDGKQVVVDFKVINKNEEDILKTEVKVTDIY